jgi:restriction system protein
VQMPKNSLFAILLRSPWWVSLAVAVVMGLVAAALLPKDYRVVGALSTFPFVVISFMAARRQWHLPNEKQAVQVLESVGSMPWPAFSAALEKAFVRDGFSVRPSPHAAVDFELERQGRVMLVSARRWKSAHIALDGLRALQEAREAASATDALVIGLGELTATARPFAAEYRIAVWQAQELAQKLHGLPLQPLAGR